MTPDAAREGRRLRVLYAAVGGGIGTLLPYLVLSLTVHGLSPTGAGLVTGLMSGVGVLVIGLWGRLGDGSLGVVRALRWSCGPAAGASLGGLGYSHLPPTLVFGAAGVLALLGTLVASSRRAGVPSTAVDVAAAVRA